MKLFLLFAAVGFAGAAVATLVFGAAAAEWAQHPPWWVHVFAGFGWTLILFCCGRALWRRRHRLPFHP